MCIGRTTCGSREAPDPPALGELSYRPSAPHSPPPHPPPPPPKEMRRESSGFYSVLDSREGQGVGLAATQNVKLFQTFKK